MDTWTTSNGDVLKVTEMSDKHIKNAVNMLRRKKNEMGLETEYSEWASVDKNIQMFEREQARRRGLTIELITNNISTLSLDNAFTTTNIIPSYDLEVDKRTGEVKVIWKDENSGFKVLNKREEEKEMNTNKIIELYRDRAVEAIEYNYLNLRVEARKESDSIKALNKIRKEAVAALEELMENTKDGYIYRPFGSAISVTVNGIEFANDEQIEVLRDFVKEEEKALEELFNRIKECRAMLELCKERYDIINTLRTYGILDGNDKIAEMTF